MLLILDTSYTTGFKCWQIWLILVLLHGFAGVTVFILWWKEIFFFFFKDRVMSWFLFVHPRH